METFSSQSHLQDDIFFWMLFECYRVLFYPYLIVKVLSTYLIFYLVFHF